MVYSFDSRIAELYGVDEAVFIHNLYFWISKTLLTGTNIGTESFGRTTLWMPTLKCISFGLRNRFEG